MSLLSFNIYKNNLPDGRQNYSLTAQEETPEGIITVKIDEIPESETWKLNVDNLVGIRTETEDVCCLTRQGMQKLASYPLEKRVILSQINYNVPESMKYYTYEDALLHYKKAYEEVLSEKKELRETLYTERVHNEKVNRQYKKIIKSLNNCITKILN